MSGEDVANVHRERSGEKDWDNICVRADVQVVIFRKKMKFKI